MNSGKHPPNIIGSPPSRFYGWAVVILLLAAFFRFFRLADHPLGVFFDPAISGLDAVRLLQRGGLTIFFPTNGGREAPFMYILALFSWLFGTTPFTIRFLTTSISLLTVAALAGFLRHKRHNIQPSTPAPARVFNLQPSTLPSLVLAVSYWHIAVSRLGQRPILVPLMAVLTFWPFLTGWRTGRYRAFILSGLAMGAAGYTYSAARLLPLILALVLLPELVSLLRRGDRGQLTRRLTQLTVFGLTAALVYLPMAWYMVNHPAQFTARASTVMVWYFLNTPATIAAEMGRNLLRVAGFFCCTGSPNPIFGLPSYPGLPFLLTPFLLLGLLTVLTRWRIFFYRLVGLWWLIGVAPSVIAIEAPHPLRMIVGVVPAAILVGLGLEQALLYIEARRPALQQWLVPAAYLLILLPVPGMFRAYFVRWTDLKVTRGVYDYAAVAIRDEILARADHDVAIYLPLSRFNDSTLLYYLSGTFARRAALTAPPAVHNLALAPEKAVRDAVWVRLYRHTALVLPPLTPDGQKLIQTALIGPTARPIRLADGETIALVAALPNDPVRFVQSPTRQVDAAFDPLRLTAAAYAPILNPDAPGWPVTLFWQAERATTTEYEIIAQLVDDQLRVWADGTARPTDWVYPTSFWRPGLDEIAAQHILKPVSADPLPPGRYRLAVAVYDPEIMRRLSLTAGESESPDTVFLGPLKVPLPVSPLPANLTPISARFGDEITLNGFNLDTPTAAPGNTLRLTLVWQTNDAPNRDYTVFTHLLDTQGNQVAGYDVQPLNGAYPTTIWSPGEQVVDPHILPLPADLPSGLYRLAVGLYHQPSGQRLPLRRADGLIDPYGRLILPTQVTILARQSQQEK